MNSVPRRDCNHSLKENKKQEKLSNFDVHRAGHIHTHTHSKKFQIIVLVISYAYCLFGNFDQFFLFFLRFKMACIFPISSSLVFILAYPYLGEPKPEGDIQNYSVFREGLRPALQVKKAYWDSNTNLSNYITTAIRLDNLLRQQCRSPCTRSEPRAHKEYQSPTEEGPEPMQLGRARVSLENRRCRALLQLCFYFRGSGHLVSACLKKSSTSKVRENYWHSCLLLKVTLHYAQESLVV